AQATGFAPTHAPCWHVSVCVQALPSLQLAPSGFAGFEHTPVCGSHVPVSWQRSDATHVTGCVPTQAPCWQTSCCVHALPSLQAEPSGFTGFEQTPVSGSQTPARWQSSIGAHVTGLAPTHAPC